MCQPTSSRRERCHLSKQRVVIVGASVAGARATEALRQQGFDGRITLIGAERELPYHKPPLSKEMLGDEPIPEVELSIHPASFFEEHAVELRLGSPAVSLDARDRIVTLSCGAQVPFDKLLIATGAAPRRIHVAGDGLDGVVYLRTLEDSRVLRERIRVATNVAVVGAGLLGLEVAAAARHAGKAVTVLEHAPVPLHRVFRSELAKRVIELHEKHGVVVRTSATVSAIEGDSRVRGVRLSDGSQLAADLVVVTIGIEPNTAWLRRSGVTVSDGVIVNEIGQTAVPGIYAAGDVARIYSRVAGDHVRFEQYGHAHDQGVGVGRAMAGATHSFVGIPSASTIAYGVRVQSIGFVRREHEIIVRGTDERMLAFLLEDGHVAGAFAFNRARDFAPAKRLVLARVHVPRAFLADENVPLVELANADR